MIKSIFPPLRIWTTLCVVWLSILAALLAFQLWNINTQQGAQNRVWLMHYTNAVAAQLALESPDFVSPKTLSQLAIPGLHHACLYVDQALVLSVEPQPNYPCPQQFNLGPNSVLKEKGLSIQIPFTNIKGNRSILAVHADDQRPTFWPTAILLLAFLVSLSGTAVFLSRRYLKKQHDILQAEPLRELKQLCQILYQTQNYRLRAKNYTQSPYKIIARMLNQMLEELQTNENELQEYAVQIQEKNDQLAAQKRMHQDRNQNLQKMFAGASHDLRQPLQAMIIFISAIKEHATPVQEPLIQKLEQVVDNLNHLFTDLLDISKLESRMTRIPKQNVELKPMLSKIYDEFEALANEKRIELRLYSRDLSVYSNPNMLERIIRNMISNAIRYTRTGGVLIGCRARNNTVWIEVWDTGRGIPQEKMSEIFNEFVQIKEDHQESSKGVGLGLFIVKRLAQLLDHSIIVNSTLKRGTLFRVIAPTQPPIALPPTEAPSLNSIITTNPSSPNPTGIIAGSAMSPPLALKVLVIDDDDDIRQGLVRMLENWGCTVSAWANLDEAQQKLSTDQHFDLMISDFQLAPEVDGLFAIEQMRATLNQPLPALIITGTQDTELLKRLDSSSTPYLRKPVRPAKLRALMQALVTSQEEFSGNEAF